MQENSPQDNQEKGETEMTGYDGDQTIGEMTLDEVAENDLEMLKDAIKNAKRYMFTNPEAAVKFVGRCIVSTLDYLGIPGAYNISGKMLDRIQKTKKIKIERRSDYQGDDVWRNGFYIYQRDLLVAFISEVLANRKSVLWTPRVQGADQFYVVTNARLND